MERTARARTGWASEERNLMWEEIRQASQEGLPLKHAFDTISQKTGRRPNSIRNYYYQSLKEQEVPEELTSLRARSFVPFEEEEIRALLKAVLTQKAKGVSVRACVQRMGGGDRVLSLRYQNKYRSILKSHPQLIDEVIEELRSEGIECPSPYQSMRTRRAPKREEAAPSEPASADELLFTLRRMIDHGNAKSEMRHREEIDRMTVRLDLMRLELARREEKMLSDRQAVETMRLGATALAETCNELLSAQDVEAAKALHPSLKERVQALEPLLT